MSDYARPTRGGYLNGAYAECSAVFCVISKLMETVLGSLVSDFNNTINIASSFGVRIR